MNARQEKFCLEYAASGNATKAAEAAGYSPRSAYSQGNRMLKNDEVQKRLRELAQEIKSSKIASAEEVQTFWTDIMRDAGEKTADRLKAASLLLRSQGKADGEPRPFESAVQIILPDNGRLMRRSPDDAPANRPKNSDDT